MGEWTNERMGEWANGRMGEWVNGCVGIGRCADPTRFCEI